MKFRKLRIAVTALCLLACVLLVALWVRTAGNGDNFQEPVFEVGNFAVYSTDGIIWAVKARFVQYSPATGSGVSFYIPPRYQATPDGFASTAIHKRRGFDMKFWSRWQWFVQAPNWFPVLVAAALAAAPWIKWRFSLRTLLIATALVAVGLGIVVAAR
jgi:hypothetical protein